MNRLNFALFVALIASGLWLIQVAYEARRVFVAVERAQTEERTLEIEHARLQLEKRAEATPLRVETLAREKLAMRTATPGITHYVSYAEAASIAAVAEPPPPSASAQAAQAAASAGGEPQ